MRKIERIDEISSLLKETYGKQNVSLSVFLKEIGYSGRNLLFYIEDDKLESDLALNKVLMDNSEKQVNSDKELIIDFLCSTWRNTPDYRFGQFLNNMSLFDDNGLELEWKNDKDEWIKGDELILMLAKNQL